MSISVRSVPRSSPTGESTDHDAAYDQGRTDVAIAVSAVTKTFATARGPFTALEETDLAVGRGELVVLIGPSGCGKTTLLRAMAGLTPVTSGGITVGGRTPDAARKAKQIGFVPQAPALLPWRTVRQNVDLLNEVNRRASGASPATAAEVEALLVTVGLAGFESAKPAELSGGMQQRVSLVRAFALGAPVLLMDEPFAALDEITRAQMRTVLLALCERSRPTVVFTTHSLEEAVLLGDRVVVMGTRPGRILRTHTIDLPRPRPAGIEDVDAFAEAVRSLRSSLRDASEVRA